MLAGVPRGMALAGRPIASLLAMGRFREFVRGRYIMTG
jgi:hypothetical protein